MVNESELKQFGELKTNVSLKTLTTVRIGGEASYLLYPHNVTALLQVIAFLKNRSVPYAIFGNGSNILASDDKFEGVIIKLNRTFNHYYKIDDGYYVEAGLPLIQLSNIAANNSYTNFEWAAGIPGSIGGAIYMNAGAYLKSISDYVEYVDVLIDGIIQRLSNHDCQFGYRSSIFQKNPEYVILGAYFKVELGDKNIILETMKSRQKRRMETQPLNYYSFGSTFRNCEVPSWKLIDDCGLRGHLIGDAKISEKHCNFLINLKNASFNDMYQLIKLCQNSVKSQFNQDLILEVERFNWNQVN